MIPYEIRKKCVELAHKGKTYAYAMNGYTGKVWGRLPVSGKRLAILGAVTGVLTGVIAGLLKLFLFS